MDNIIKLNADKQDTPCNDTNGLISITDDLLCNVRADISQSQKLSVPIAQLSTLGAGVASLLPAFRTVTQTSAVSTVARATFLRRLRQAVPARQPSNTKRVSSSYFSFITLCHSHVEKGCFVNSEL